MEKFFKLKEHGTDVKTEILAGITTFVTMAYIIFVNPQILSQPAFIVGDEVLGGQIANGVFFATCIAAFIGTLMMALYAKIPFAQAPGMGLNAFFAFTVVLGMGYTYNQGLGIVFFSGILFIILTAVGAREAIVKAIPTNIKFAISGGVGLFLALVGLKNAGLVVANESTFVSIVDFSKMAENRVAIMGALLAIIGIIIISVLYTLKVKGAIIIGIVATTIIGIPMGVTDLSGFSGFANFGSQFATQWGDFVHTSLFKLDLVSFFTGQGLLQAILTVIMLVITFSLVDMFDTIGTLLGTAKKANLLDKDGNMVNMKKALMCDAVATAAGACLGTSTVTTFVESSAGIGEGGRTGLTSLVTAVLFLVALFAAPFLSIIPGAATAPALIFVGVLMMSAIKDINFEDVSEAVPAFLTLAMMPFTYSIANGIAAGLISYTLIKLLSGKVKQLRVVTVVLAVLFIIRYAFMSL